MNILPGSGTTGLEAVIAFDDFVRHPDDLEFSAKHSLTPLAPEDF